MNIIFYSVESGAPRGLVTVDDESNKLRAAGIGIDIANTWSASGRSAAQFAERYASWSNGYTYSAIEPSEDDVTVAFTIDDEGNVLELIKSDKEGIAVRENGDWEPVDIDGEQPSIEDQEWLDVTDEAIEFWDAAASSDVPITRDKVLEYALEPE